MRIGIAIIFLVLWGGVAIAEQDASAGDEQLESDFLARSHPPDLSLVSLLNPWGERIESLEVLPDDFGQRVVSAAEMYARQGIRFDGYFGSDDDGRHYHAAADGEDGAYYGNAETGTYRKVADGHPDDLKERVWICLDVFVHSYTLAGFPLRAALVADYERRKDTYTIGGTFPENDPKSMWFFRRIRNVQNYFRHHQHYSEQRITTAQYRDPQFRPLEAFQIGDLAFFGHYGDLDGEKGWWRPQHTAIVASVDERGLPVRLVNMRVSQGLIDEYDGKINQTRPIGDKQVYFERFSDRYSLIGFGRVVAWPELSSEPLTE